MVTPRSHPHIDAREVVYLELNSPTWRARRARSIDRAYIDRSPDNRSRLANPPGRAQHSKARRQTRRPVKARAVDTLASIGKHASRMTISTESDEPPHDRPQHHIGARRDKRQHCGDRCPR